MEPEAAGIKRPTPAPDMLARFTGSASNIPIAFCTLYVPTDFDTIEKALSVAKAAEKGLK